MSQTPNPGGQLQPLNIGNIVSAGIVLYRSHFQSYVRVAFVGLLWLLLPVLIVLGLIASVFSTVISGGSISGVTWLLSLLWLGFFIFCLTKYLLYSALLTRLGFKELTNQPETVNDARQQLNTRLWSFFWLAVCLGLLMIGVYIVLAIGFVIAIFAIAFVLTPVLGSVGTAIVSTAVFAILLVLTLTWFFSRWFVAEAVLSTEESATALNSLGRSWELTKTAVFRIQGVVLVTFLVTLPIQLLINYLPSSFLNRIEPGSSLFWGLYFISIVLSFAVSIVLIPFWQSVRAVLYYDLRNRREGLGLQFRDRPQSY